MADLAPHPLEAQFARLVLVRQFARPVQVKRAEEVVAQRRSAGQEARLDRVLLELGLLTAEQSQRLWSDLGRGPDGAAPAPAAPVPSGPPARAEGEAGPDDETSADLSRPSSRAVPEKEVQIPGYEILETIGRGGMGVVYRARQLALDRDVALKLLPTALCSDEKFIRRFIREARAAGRLDHPNLVMVYDVAQSGGRFYISMEYVGGRTIRQIMQREGRISVAESLRIVEQVAAALECAHRNQIIHRDIKPDNIMLTPQGVAKLCDLGLAKVLARGAHADSETEAGQAVGTPYYMSPEQARGSVEARSDLYSLGATWYHMVTGRVPFDGATPLEILLRLSQEQPVPPDRLEPLLPPPVSRLIQRLLAKDPLGRPRDAADLRRQVWTLRQDLEAGRIYTFFEAPRPGGTAARARSIPPRPAAPRRRHYGFWGLGGALAFLALCVAWRVAAAPPAPPLPELPQAKAGASASGTSGTQTGGVPGVASGPGPAAWSEWEQKLETDAQAWVWVLNALEAQRTEMEGAAPEVAERYHKLQQRALQARDRAATREFAARRAGAAALAQAGLFRRAAVFVRDLPAPLAAQTGLVEATTGEAARLLDEAPRDSAARASEIEGLAQAGLLPLARQHLELWQAELAADGAEPDGPRSAAARAVAQKLDQALAQSQEKERTWTENRRALADGLAQIRRLSGAHDLAGAQRLCRTRFEQARDEAQNTAYAAELLRLQLVQNLFAALGQALRRRPGEIAEEEFRRPVEPGARLVGLEDGQFLLAIPRGQASLNLSQVSRDEMRALFARVFREPGGAPDEPAGRLAYELEEPPPAAPGAVGRAARARAALVALARSQPRAAALLELLRASEAWEARARAHELVARAEEFFLQARYRETQETVAEALEALGSREEAQSERAAQALLRSAAAARASGWLLAGPYAALPHDRVRWEAPADYLAKPGPDWTWLGAPPVLQAASRPAALLCGGPPLRGQTAWSLTGPALVLVELRLPAGKRGALTLSATGQGAGGTPEAGESWALKADEQPGGLQAALARTGWPEPGWGRLQLAADTYHRLWLRLDVGQASWGSETGPVATRPAGPGCRWRLGLEIRGDLLVHGLQVEGHVEGPAPREDRERAGRDFLARAEALPVAEREALFTRAGREWGAFAALASRAAAGLAACCHARGADDEARQWEQRALFECPASLWPPQTAALLAEHKRWQLQREARGLERP